MTIINSLPGQGGSTSNFGSRTQDSAPGAQASDMRSWYEAMANAWGSVLDGQATEIMDLSNKIGTQGHDNPATMTMLTAESMRMQFLSQNASTSMSSVGQALEALARK